MSASVMQPENLSIGSLLAHRAPFTVPLYQRAYAWEREEIEDFVDDITALLRQRLVSPTAPKSHFFGGMVSVHRIVSGSKTGGMYEVVDGQQRLATFVLAIALILRGYKKIGKQAAKEEDTQTEKQAKSSFDVDMFQYLRYSAVDDSGNKLEPLRLTLSKSDASYFERAVDGRAPTPERDSHRRIRDAIRRLERGLVHPIVDDVQLSARAKWEKLQALLFSITDDCNLIHIVSSDRNEAYRLFAILNDRGRSLSEGDLLRTVSLELLERHPALQQQAEADWDSILSVSTNDVDDFLRSYYASHIGERASKRELFDQFRKHFFDFKAPISFDDARATADTIERLKIESIAYQRISDGVWPYQPGQASEWQSDRLWRLIKVLRREICVPLLMSVYRVLDERRFVQVVQMLEHFDFRYLVAGGHAGSLGDKYYAQAKLIRDQGPSYDLESLRSAAEELVARVAPDAVFSVNLVERLKYSTRSGTNALLRHFLTTVDDYSGWLEGDAKGPLATDQMFKWSFGQIEVEHIYPQSSPIRDPEMEDLKHDLGNLTFWAPTDNKVASNASFDVKRARYADSRVLLNRQIALYDEWGPKQVVERRRRLVESAQKIYALSPNATRPADTAGPASWLVYQAEKSVYEDVEGASYHYPNHIANARHIKPLDTIICFRPGVAEHEVIGVARIGRVESDGSQSRAYYDRYLRVDPPIRFADIGGDPRTNMQNAINRAPEGLVEALLTKYGDLTVDDIPETAAAQASINPE
jgi:hypothetical protein